MSLHENFKSSDNKKQVDIFANQEFTKSAPDIIALHNAIFPAYQANFRKHIEEILGKPFITVKATNERIKQSKAYEKLIANNINYKKGVSGEIMQAANKLNYKREHRKIS